MKKDDTGYENEPDITSKKLVRPFTVLPAAKRERSWDKMREREAQEELEFRTTMLQMSYRRFLNWNVYSSGCRSGLFV